MDNNTMFDFYKMSFDLGYLEESDIHKATKFKCISNEQYKQITGKEYTE